jgi:AraC-like DNA-binding protein
MSDPATRILDVAFASGFNSKSTFNETFRKYAGATPTVWRSGAALTASAAAALK